MNVKFKDIDIKNRMFYLFDDMINIKNTDPNKIKIHGKSHSNTFIYYIGHVIIKIRKN